MKDLTTAGNTSTVAPDVGASNKNLAGSTFSLSHGNTKVSASNWGIVAIVVIAVVLAVFVL